MAGSCALQKSTELLQELHTVVGQHTCAMESQQSEICRLESEVADLLRSRASVQKELDDAVDMRECLQQLNEKQVSQHKLDVWTTFCRCQHVFHSASQLVSYGIYIKVICDFSVLTEERIRPLGWRLECFWDFFFALMMLVGTWVTGQACGSLKSMPHFQRFCSQIGRTRGLRESQLLYIY